MADRKSEKYIESPSSLKKKNTRDPKRFVEQGHCTSDGEIASHTITSLDQARIEEEAIYDGFMLSALISSTPWLIS